jgi:cell division protein FtsL
MLSTPVRKEINQDVNSVQERELKTYAQHSLYGGQQTVSETVYERKAEHVNLSELSADTLGRRLYGDTYDTSRSAYRSESAQAKTDYSNPDLMPSRTTMSYPGIREHYNREYTGEKTNAKIQMPARTKILIAGYIAVVLALVLIITLASVSIATLFGEVGMLENELGAQVAAVNELQSDVDDAASVEVIMDTAQNELGMKLPDGAAVKLPSASVKDTPGYTVEGNGFDSFLKWLSGLFN